LLRSLTWKFEGKVLFLEKQPIMEQILSINEHPYWEANPKQRKVLEARINELLAAGNIYEDGEILTLNLLGSEVKLRAHVQTTESRVSGDAYNILDLELIGA